MSKPDYIDLCIQLTELELLDFHGIEIDYDLYDSLLAEIRQLEEQLGIDKPFEGTVFFYD